MLNSAEHEICPANKNQITNNCKLFLLNTAEHEHFSANKYEYANNLISMKMPTVFSIFILISSAELNLRNVL